MGEVLDSKVYNVYKTDLSIAHLHMVTNEVGRIPKRQNKQVTFNEPCLLSRQTLGLDLKSSRPNRIAMGQENCHSPYILTRKCSSLSSKQHDDNISGNYVSRPCFSRLMFITHPQCRACLIYSFHHLLFPGI